jgi:phospholipase C
LFATIVVAASFVGSYTLYLVSFVPPGQPVRPVRPNSPIEHVVVIIKENHAFDNYFGTFPAADGIPPNVSLPDGNGANIAPHWIASNSTNDLPHSRPAMLEAWNNGSNDRFAVVATQWGPGRAFESMGYYDERQLPYYWELARKFTLADHYFQSMFGPTDPNRFFSFAGTNAGLETNFIQFATFDGLTIFDQLQAKGVSWRYYYEPTSFHAPLPMYFRTLSSNPEAANGMVPLDRLLPDIQRGDLAQVTYVDPSDSSTISEHPAQNVSLGETWTKTLVNAIVSSAQWSTTAILLTMDESGGYYDHLSPPQVDEWGYGFRVPMLVISPFAKRGWIDSDVMDHTSILKLIADNWGLPYLTQREAKSGRLIDALVFGPAAAVLSSPTTMTASTLQSGQWTENRATVAIRREPLDWESEGNLGRWKHP